MNDHTMDVLSKEGHTTTAWDPNNPAEVEAARATFNALTRRPQISEEQSRRQAELDERARRHEQELNAARAKARELLLEHLTSDQRAQMLRDGFFVVEGGKSKKKYRINVNRGVAGNIEEICEKTKAIVARLCCHASYEYPNEDQFLTQKLMLELDEEAFLRVANRR